MKPSRRLQELQDLHGPEAGGIIYRQETELAQLKRGTNIGISPDKLRKAVEDWRRDGTPLPDGLDIQKALEDLDESKMNRVAFRQSTIVNRTLRYFMGELSTPGTS